MSCRARIICKSAIRVIEGQWAPLPKRFVQFLKINWSKEVERVEVMTFVCSQSVRVSGFLLEKGK